MNYRFQVKGVLSAISQVFISLLRLLLPIGRTLEKYFLWIVLNIFLDGLEVHDYR